MGKVRTSLMLYFCLSCIITTICLKDRLSAQERGFVNGPTGQFREGMHGPSHQGGRPPAMRSLFEDLGISKDQREKLMQIRKESNMRSLREKLNEEREALREMFRDRSKNDKEIFAQLDKVSNAQVELNQIRVKNVLAMRSILSEEQFNRLSERLQNRRPPMGNHQMGERGFQMGGGMRSRPQFQDGGMPMEEGSQSRMRRNMPGREESDGVMIDPFEIE